jgi:hypothetical protein
MKYAGMIGFEETSDQGNDLWEQTITERFAYGDVLNDTRRMDDSQQVNPNYGISARFSLVADAYFFEHLAYLRYVTYKGVKWEVSSVDPTNYPRIIVNVNQVYNGPEVESDE